MNQWENIRRGRKQTAEDWDWVARQWRNQVWQDLPPFCDAQYCLESANDAAETAHQKRCKAAREKCGT